MKLHVQPSVFPPSDYQALSERVARYASGLSRFNDFTVAAWAGHAVGVVAGEMSPFALRELACAVNAWRTPTFFDTGAYGAFRAQRRTGVAHPVDFDAAFDVYERFTENVWRLNAVEEELPKPLFVMPDVVGDQDATLDLLRRYRDQVADYAAFNVARPVIALHRGRLSLAELYTTVAEMIGSDRFVCGIPSNAVAIGEGDFVAFLQSARPRAVHVLGAFAESRIRPRLEQILASGIAETIDVSADANPLRSVIVERGQREDDRRARLADVLSVRTRQDELEGWIASLGGEEGLKAAHAAADDDRRRRMVGLISDLAGVTEFVAATAYGLPYDPRPQAA